jgi:hypothetical protein
MCHASSSASKNRTAGNTTVARSVYDDSASSKALAGRTGPTLLLSGPLRSEVAFETIPEQKSISAGGISNTGVRCAHLSATVTLSPEKIRERSS